MEYASDVIQDARKKEELSKYQKYEIHEGILFCIELSRAMFEESPDVGKPQLVEILETLLEVMSQVIITLPSTGIGCYFFRCENKGARNGIYEYLPLRDVNAKALKTLSDLLDDIQTGIMTLESEFPLANGKTGYLEDVFTVMQEQFLADVAGQKAFNNKKIFLFTDNDTPPECTDARATSRIRKVVDDLDDYHINFVPFFLGSKAKPFDQSFYHDILRLGSRAQPSEDLPNASAPVIPPLNVRDMKSRALRKKEIKRIRFQCPFILDEKSDFLVSLKGYTIVSHEKPGTKYQLVYDHEGMRKKAHSTRKYLDNTTGEDVTESTTRVYKFGETDIELSSEQMQEISETYSKHESFLKLIGFRSSTDCLFYYSSISSSSFVVPDETKFEGSIRTMASMFRIMRQKQQAAIVWGKLKSNSSPGLYALATTDDFDRNEGFYLTRLPFIDEIRKFPSSLPTKDLLTTDEYNQMCKITETIVSYYVLRRRYKASEFQNPNLQNHFNLLHDYLLQVEDVKNQDEEEQLLEKDDTLKKLYQIRQKILDSSEAKDSTKARLSQYVKAWNSVYNREFNLESNFQSEKGSKRPKK
ncbi:LAMI_0G01222g1_1 [Lachancea mirantina]|uniref:ATP-dependent DNA helicase II subunit 1 n=1 Tax=Lachancea mirantina TaxID=1230905 RepID=A0A1G4K7G3_9SACH|nr:LAMI_0G01222g1_1 [Lachancea mirantina]